MRIAVIDLGTNTFNLLIVDVDPATKQCTKVYNEKLAPKIGRGGINNGLIAPDAIERGLAALRKHKQVINEFACDRVEAIGTSALRNAANGAEFVELAHNLLGINIEIISGEREAELIYKGNNLAVDMSQPSLILDIGGGSNEFIIADNTRVYWKHSFELGMQRLLHLFQPQFPLSDECRHAIEEYLDQNLTLLYDALAMYPTHTLIGSSGTFDTFRCLSEQTESTDNFSQTSFEISLATFAEIHRLLTTTPPNELLKVKGIDIQRLEFLPVATVFVHFIIERLQISRMIQSAYSLKEGVIAEVITH